MLDGHFRVHLYNLSKDGNSPGEEIIFMDSTYVASKVKNKFYIDVSEYNINYPDDGIFVGLEWIGTSSKEYRFTIPSIKLTNKIKESLTWSKNVFRKDEWELLDQNKSLNALYTGVILNACFGISVTKVK